ncbi:hypothetical protein B5P46_01630 [Rhizobium leguminosarum]|uniref:Lantibiotic dehydratase N-terminal domain-containing protein n=1 Tax=Rhizobium leguminosarum TaxID=384 RepID=A0A4V1P351_RHILE|nr:hypothetical protein [Rhizobium leguminosarum]RXT29800.1 hypothetical protein B5P46_01630 [Rhizobium leguminosarum]
MVEPERNSALSAMPILPSALLLRDFVVRSSGLPFSLLEALALNAKACVSLDAATKARIALAAAANSLRSVLRPLESQLITRSAARRLRARAKAGVALDQDARATIEDSADAPMRAALCEYDAALVTVAAAERIAREAFDQGLLRTRTALAESVNDERFQEALHNSNATLSENGSLAPGKPDVTRNSRTRRRERTATLYLQRFAAKNETNARFGPVNDGVILCTLPQIGLALFPASPPVRKGYVAHWLIDEIVRSIEADPDLQPLLPLVGGGLRRNDPLRILEGQSRDMASERVLDHAASSGRLRASLRVPSNVVDQLDWLSVKIASLRVTSQGQRSAQAGWLAILAGFDADRRAFAKDGREAKTEALASAEERYRSFSSGELRRHAGRMFRTRTLLYEECHGGGRVDLEEATLYRCKDDLAALILASRVDDHLRRDKAMTTAIKAYDSAFEATPRVRFDKFIALLASTPAQPVLDSDEIAFRRGWADVLARAGADDAWDTEALESLAGGRSLVPYFDLSPDLLASANATEPGEVTWTLGELHHGVTMDGWMLDASPRGLEVSASIAALKAAQTKAAAAQVRFANLVLARHMKAAPQIYSGLVIELSGRVEGASAHALGLADLVVERQPRRLVLRVAGDTDPRPLVFHAPAFGFSPDAYRAFELFSAPVLRLPDLIEPSALVDSTVFAARVRQRLGRRRFTIYRERWRLNAHRLVAIAQLSTTEARYVEFRRQARQVGLPRYAFLRSSGEPKPVLLDIDSPLLVEAALGLIKPSDTVTIEEMLPNADELWLDGSHDGRRTSEFRFLIVGGANGS